MFVAGVAPDLKCCYRLGSVADRVYEGVVWKQRAGGEAVRTQSVFGDREAQGGH